MAAQKPQANLLDFCIDSFPCEVYPRPTFPSISVKPFKNMALGYRDHSGLRDHEEENIAPQNPANSFGELLFQLRSRQRLSLRSLGERAGVTASLISEFENARRPPPAKPAVTRLAQALELSPRDTQRLAELASRERSGMGLRVARSTPRHVADLLRDIACIGQQLSPAHVRSIRQSLEVAMK
jgi:transcriptional regulator with XRE-family HTH domain